jgi:MFS family permease
MTRRSVGRYYAYRATLSVGFITPVFTLFLLRTLSFTEVGVLSAVYAGLSVVGEIPTGYVADHLGQRTSLLCSVAATVASLAGFVLVSSFAWYVVLYALWALALTLRSGSIDAWLYEALDEHLDADDFSHVRGRGDAVQRATSAVTMVGGGLLYGLDPTYPFVAAVAFTSLGFVTLLSLPANGCDGDGDGADTGPGPRETFGLLRRRLLRPPLRSLVLFVGLFAAVLGVAAGYVQPMAVERLGPTASALGVSLPAGGAVAAARSGSAGPALALGLGVLYAGLSAVSSVGGYYAGAVERRLGVRGTLLAVTVATSVLLVLPVGLALLALPAFVAVRTGPAVFTPVAHGYVNDAVDGAGRATTLSGVSMLSMLVRTPLALAAGVVADATTATTAVATLGAGLFMVGGAVWLAGDVAPGGGDAPAVSVGE